MAAYGLKLMGARAAGILHGRPEAGPVYADRFSELARPAGPGRRRTLLSSVTYAAIILGMACSRALEVAATGKALAAMQNADSDGVTIGTVRLARTLGGSLAALLDGLAGPEREALLAAEPALTIRYEPTPPTAELTFRKGRRLYSMPFQVATKSKLKAAKDSTQLASKNVVLNAACIDALAAVMLEHNGAPRNVTTSGSKPEALKTAQRTSSGGSNANGAAFGEAAPSRNRSETIPEDDRADHPTDDRKIVQGRPRAQSPRGGHCDVVIRCGQNPTQDTFDDWNPPPRQPCLGL